MIDTTPGMDSDSVSPPPEVSTPRPGRYSEDRPIMTSAIPSGSACYTDVGEEVQFRRNPEGPSSSEAARREAEGRSRVGYEPRDQPPPDYHHHSSAYGFRPEPYDGEGDWSEYLVMFEHYAEFSRWDPRTKASMLGFCLRGPARSVLASLPEPQRVDFDSLKEALTQNFSPREQIHLYQAELKSRVRRSGESLTSLGRDIARLVRFAYPTADDHTRQTIGINAFLDALPCGAIEIRLHVAKGRPVTLQQAIAYAMEVDAVLEAEARRGHAPRRGQVKATADPEVQALEQLRGELQKALDQMRAEIEKNKWGGARGDLTCYRCGKKGHMRRDCRVPADKIPQHRGNEGERLPRPQ